MASPEPSQLDWSGLPLAELDRHLPCQLPWLALPFPEASDACRFYSLPDGKIHSRHLPEARGSHCCGSSFGWMAFLHTSINLFLLNPLTRQRIRLPPLNNTTIPDVPEKVSPESGVGYIIRQPSGVDFPCDFEYVRRDLVHRFALSSDPTSADCVAMASFCHSDTFAFCCPGDDNSSWTTLTSPVSTFQDIAFYQGRFYTVDTRLALYACDVGPPERIQEFPYCSWGEDLPKECFGPLHVERCQIQGRRRRGEIIESVYLVESRGSLLMVVRTYDDIFALPYDGDEGHLMLDFEVYKLELSGEHPRWVELESLGGDQVLFLGPGCSVCFSIGDFPENAVGTAYTLVSTGRRGITI